MWCGMDGSEKVEKRGFSAVGNGILWLTPCKLACERSLETDPNKVVCGGIVCDMDFAMYDISARDVTTQNGSLSGLYILKVGAVAKKVIVAQ